jgi:1,4-dihydroxy-2-naphthoate octaprenyltransferase
MKLRHAIPPIFRIVRVHIVVGGVLAFLLGVLLALVGGGGTLDPTRVALFYAIVFFGDLSTHYGNDYFDVESDKYVERRKFFSGKNILVNNPGLRSSARSISIALLILSNVLALSAVIFQVVPPWLLIITLGANFLGWSYSAPPLRLVSRGLGEAAIALAVGFAIPAVGYLAVRGQFDSLFLYFVLPFVLYGFMLGLSLEAPDIEVDRKVGKLNIGARKGRRAVFSLILAVASSSSLMFLFYAWQLTLMVVDLRMMVLFSIIPLTAGLAGFIRVFQNKEVNRFSTLNIMSLFLFNVFMILYLGALCFFIA